MYACVRAQLAGRPDDRRGEGCLLVLDAVRASSKLDKGCIHEVWGNEVVRRRFEQPKECYLALILLQGEPDSRVDALFFQST